MRVKIEFSYSGIGDESPTHSNDPWHNDAKPGEIDEWLDELLAAEVYHNTLVIVQE